ncbi:MAG: bifunctional phosphoribosyl-AMP cyclohydrolase/phosphoribosyl-ATP diphosphatase HisIE, partial [Steroidobacteraceae bacterium]
MNPDEIADLDWDKGGGLLPAVVQHAGTGAVLMLGYMNQQALSATLADGRVTFFSRRSKKLWTKGETSGHFLAVAAVSADCDRDTILIQALPSGPVCHNGSATCFPRAPRSDAERLAFLAELERVISRRIAEQTAGSYTAELHAGGPRRLAQKVGEEAVELVVAAVDGDDAELLAESADLIYHLAVLL